MNEDEYYVLISDGDEVPALFKISEGLEQIRKDGEWTDPTEDDIEALDGLVVATIKEEFVSVYDEIQAEKKTPNKEDVEPYTVESE